MNGVATARMIRAQRHNRATSLIAFTPLSEKTIPVANRNLSDAFLIKPIASHRPLELAFGHVSGRLAKA